MTRPNLQDAASIAEIISSVAVLATLISLVVEIRENTSAVRASSYQDLVDGRIERYYAMLEHDGLAKTFARVLEPGGLSEDDFSAMDETTRAQMRISSLTYWLEMENAFIQYRHGTLSDEDWGHYVERMCRNIGRRQAEPDRDLLDRFLSRSFLTHRARACEGAGRE